MFSWVAVSTILGISLPDCWRDDPIWRVFFKTCGKPTHFSLSQSVRLLYPVPACPDLYTVSLYWPYLVPNALPLHARRIWYGTSSPGKCTYASWLPGSPIFMASLPTPSNVPNPRNKVLIFGLIKGHQWLISPDQGAVGWLAMILEVKVETWKTWEGFILGCCPPWQDASHYPKIMTAASHCKWICSRLYPITPLAIHRVYLFEKISLTTRAFRPV